MKLRLQRSLREGSTLAGMLRPTQTPAVNAQVLPNRRLLLPKGAFLDCTLETAIDSTFDGMVTCIGASDIYSADGKVVLLERGTKYVGEKRGELRQGQGRVFVLWNEARTPTGVVVHLASPGTDELGRTGLPGQVDTHFWEPLRRRDPDLRYRWQPAGAGCQPAIRHRRGRRQPLRAP